jgi:hypothetical protein
MERRENPMDPEGFVSSDEPYYGSVLSNMNENITVTNECELLIEAQSMVDTVSPAPDFIKSTAHIMSAAWIVLEDTYGMTLTVDREEASLMMFNGCVKAMKDVMATIMVGA